MAAYANPAVMESDDPTGFYTPGGDRRIKDIVHEEIHINPYLSRFIDTEHFQRLRDVKQLGTSSYVWPSATHTRFEHCIGVAYLAHTLASHLRTSQPHLGITMRDIACVEIAGLCHDLGHGPWSHVWDGIFMPKVDPESEWKHEQGSDMMFDDMVKANNIPIPQKDVQFIKALIAGEPADCDASEKRFLFDIVANKRNGLDVDKFDYIQRDSRMTREDFSFPVTRILRSAQVFDNQICYNIKDANQIYRICQRRFDLHKHVYNHKTARAIEYMIVDALILADPYMKIAKRVFKPETFLRLNDHIMHEIEWSTDPRLEPSRQLLKRIRKRDLYRWVDVKTIDFFISKEVEKYVTSERIFKKVEEIRASRKAASPMDPEEEDTSDLTVDDIIVDMTMMHHGMKQHNPVDFTKFYSKRNNTPMNAGPGDYSELRPPCHAESLLRIYTKKSAMKYLSIIQEAYRAVLHDFDETSTAEEATTPTTTTISISPEGSVAAVGAPTAPSVAPTTPGSDVGSTSARTTRKLVKIASQNNFTSLGASPMGSRRTSPMNDFASNNAGVKPLSTQVPAKAASPAFATFDGAAGRLPLSDLFQDEEPEKPHQPPESAGAGSKSGQENALLPSVELPRSTERPYQHPESAGAGSKRGRENTLLPPMELPSAKRKK